MKLVVLPAMIAAVAAQSFNVTGTLVKSWGPCGKTIPEMMPSFTVQQIGGDGMYGTSTALVYMPNNDFAGIAGESYEELGAFKYVGGCLYDNATSDTWGEWPCHCYGSPMGLPDLTKTFDFALSCKVEKEAVTAMCNGVYKYTPPPCTTDEYCSPETNQCMNPTNEPASCYNGAACEGGTTCDGLTKTCGKAGSQCTSSCTDEHAYCSPNLGHCLSPTDPGVLCDASTPCSSSSVCDSLTHVCVTVGVACVPNGGGSGPSRSSVDTFDLGKSLRGV